MRIKLKQFVDQRIAVSAIVGGFGQRSVHWHPFGIDTILLNDITHESEILIDAVWMNRGKWAGNLVIGNSISFAARVRHYSEGYQCHRDHFGGEPITQEYGLERPTKVETRASPTYASYVRQIADTEAYENEEIAIDMLRVFFAKLQRH